MENNLSFFTLFKIRIMQTITLIMFGWRLYKGISFPKRVWLFLKRGYKIAFTLLEEGEVREPK